MKLQFKTVTGHGFYTGEVHESEYLCYDEVFRHFPEMTENMKTDGFELQIFHRPGKNRKRFIVKKNPPRFGLFSSCTIMAGDTELEGDRSIREFADINGFFNRPLYVKMVPLPEKG